MMRVMVLLFVLIFQEILRQTAQDSTTNRAQKTVPGLLAEHVASNAATDSAQKATLAFAHGRCVRVVVGRIRVAGLWFGLMMMLLLLLLMRCGVAVGGLLVVLARLHALLVGLVLRVGVAVAVLGSRRTACPSSQHLEPKTKGTSMSLLVPYVSLRVARIVGAVLMALNTHLESTMLRRAEAVRPGWWRKSLILIATAL
jgi:uncharacterized membrane protein